jgi:ABC-type multidrug transport system ATPase subunit
MGDLTAPPGTPQAATGTAIAASGVRKAFGQVQALAGVDLAVSTGTLTALLGPNGAGKTTLVRIIATLARPDAGQVRVFGYDVVRQARQVRARIGLTGQYAGLDDALDGHDNLILIGRLAGLSRRQAASRAAELAAALGLAEASDRMVRTYSGGMRRRLDLAASLLHRPELLVLDEPTTGLDPGSRQQLWTMLTELKAAGTTMLLTTQYLEEADRFADVVHVLHHGRVVASGTPGQLKARAGAEGASLDDAFLALTRGTGDRAPADPGAEVRGAEARGAEARGAEAGRAQVTGSADAPGAAAGSTEAGSARMDGRPGGLRAVAS